MVTDGLDVFFPGDIGGHIWGEDVVTRTIGVEAGNIE